MSDPILLVVEAAFELHEQGKLNRDELVVIIEEAINAVSLTNGYADQFGLPFPDRPLANNIDPRGTRGQGTSK